jgi:hypothetical protein
VKLWLVIWTERFEWHVPFIRLFRSEAEAQAYFVGIVQDILSQHEERTLLQLLEHCDRDQKFLIASTWIHEMTDDHELEVREMEVPEPEPVN